MSRWFAIGWLLFLAGCVAERSFDVQGRIVGFGDDGRTVIVEHEEIPGFMSAMVMPFRLAEAGGLNAFAVGDAVGFTLVVGRDQSWIEGLRALPDSALAARPAATADPLYDDASRFLAEGDPVPDFTLLAQTGDSVRLADFEGRAMLLTFIYTRCPLPEFCPRLSAHFARLQPLLRERFGDRVHLLSVSFDPAFDTPEILRSYARRYTDDLDTWTFATGAESDVAQLAEPFGLYFARTGQDFNHNLATALIGPEGHLRRLWRGTAWQPEEVLRAVEATLGASRP